MQQVAPASNRPSCHLVQQQVPLYHRYRIPWPQQWMRSVCHGKIRKHTPSHYQPYWAKRWCCRTPHARESFWLLRGGPTCLGIGIQWPCPVKSYWACPICPTCWRNHSIRSLTEIWQILISMHGSWSLSIRGAGLLWGGGSKNWGSSKGINQISLWGKVEHFYKWCDTNQVDLRVPLLSQLLTYSCSLWGQEAAVQHHWWLQFNHCW